MTRRRRPTAPTVPPPPTAGWWGDGPPPWDRWPGVSIRLDAVWTGARWESPCGRYYFDEAKAGKPARFFRGYLRHTKGEFAGKPFELLPWQDMLIFRPLFGWCRTEDGYRRFRQVFVEVAKKNGKSAIASGLALLLATADGEPGAEVYSAAGDEVQARIVFDEASNMAEGSPDYLADLGVEVLTGSIVQERSKSKYQVLTAKASTKHGFNVHGLVLDELHTQKTRALVETLEKGVSARRQPVVFKITTAGDDRESICYEEYEVAKRVIAGESTNEQLLPVVFETSPEDDWSDERTWHKANPSLGITKSLDYMRAECKAAQEEPRKRNAFLRLDLDQWTESRTVWIAPEAWAECGPAKGTTREQIREADVRLLDFLCCAGLDISSAVDLTALAAAYKVPDDLPVQQVEVEVREGGGETVKRIVSINYSVELRVWFWMPRERLRENMRKTPGIPFDLWAREGWLRVTDGNVIDQNAILRFIEDEFRPRHKKLHEIGYDPWQSIPLVATLLESQAPLVEVRQGYATLSAPAKLFEALILSGRLRHDGNPVMRWNVANCEIASDPAGNIKPVKPGGDARSSRRIDGVPASLNALSRLMLAPEPKRSAYADRGVRIISW